MDRIPLLLLLSLSLPAADTEWPINGGPYNIRYTELDQITPANVTRREVAWTWDAHEAFRDSGMQSNPIVVNGVLFATTPKLHVVALDAQAGQEIWNFDATRGETIQRRFRHRGVTIYKDRVFTSYRNWLYALDFKTGKPIRTFGDDGRIDLRRGLDRPFESLSVSASSPLEIQPSPNLHKSRKVALRQHLSEAAAPERGIGRAEVRRVECIQTFEPELRFHTLANREVFEKRDVPVGQSRPAQRNRAADITESQRRCKRERRRVDPVIDALADIAGGGRRDAGRVRALAGAE
jgi:hypothetical protein